MMGFNIVLEENLRDRDLVLVPSSDLSFRKGRDDEVNKDSTCSKDPDSVPLR